MELDILSVAKYLHGKYSGTCRFNTDKRRKHTIVVRSRLTGKKRIRVKLFRPETWDEADNKTRRKFVSEAKKILKIAGVYENITN